MGTGTGAKGETGFRDTAVWERDAMNTTFLRNPRVLLVAFLGMSGYLVLHKTNQKVGIGTAIAAERTATAPESPIRLRLTAPPGPVHLDRKRVIRVVLQNQGKASVTLVKPGDGSWDAWRTPIVGWSILSTSDSASRHTPPHTTPQFRGCDNLDSVGKDTVFTLAPGQCEKLKSWPDFPGPGTYRVVYFYRNEPLKKWHGTYGAAPGVMEQIRKSTACTLQSNELVVTVVP